MSTLIKSPVEIKKMRVAGKLAAEALEYTGQYVKPGISTRMLDQICHEYITKEQKAIPASLNYHGFPNAICISVNDVVCHGIPNDYILQSGDIVNLDVAVIKDGYHGDTSCTFPVGQITPEAQALCDTTRHCLYEAIRLVKPFIRLKKIGQLIERIAQARRYSVVKIFCGHGIGKNYHEPPEVLHVSATDHGFVLKPGMTFTIEPILNAGGPHVLTLEDNWTVKTCDGSLSAQYEHTILVTETGHEVLTLRSNEPFLS